MKKSTNTLAQQFICTLAFLLISTSIFAQAPEKMSYQAVVRDASNNLVTNQGVGMKVSILKGAVNGSIVYAETQTPTTNANGLVSLEIGTGTVVSGTFSSINWANDTYFIKTETDPTGGTNYSIIGTTQLMSVPYALHANTADSITGNISYTETDPVFGASVASGITGTDTTNWNNKLDSYTETDPVYGASVASGITGTDTTNWNNKLDSYTETDPVFGASVASGITGADTINWNSKLDSYTETDPVFGASIASGITGTDTNNWNNKLDSYTETDPIYGASVASGITGTDTTNWNNKLDSYTETDPTVPTGTQTGEMQYWNGTAWVMVAAGSAGQILSFNNGVPIWVTLIGGKTVGPTDVYNPITGEIWMDRNLGAAQVATSSNDTAAFGDLYQWGRGKDGHQIRTSDTTLTLSNTDVPGHGDFIVSYNDWRNPPNTNLWQGVNGINNPCPSGYRLPTNEEWKAERLSWTSNDSAGAFASPLKLTIGAVRRSYNASIMYGRTGHYWSSDVTGPESGCMIFDYNKAFNGIRPRGDGLSVRCIKD